jgi:hypothetical protein
MSAESLARLPPRTGSTTDDLQLLRFKLREGESAAVENFGIPAVCESDGDQAILDEGAPIEGIMSLRELCRQKEFVVIVSNCSTRLASVNNQLRDVFPREMRPVYPYVNGYVFSRHLGILSPADPGFL